LLTNLYIKNFALIDTLDVSFTEGLSILTGETGAGKSIILGGLNLILGNRADLSSINSTDEKCVIEATFAVEKYKLQQLFKQLELDYDNQTIIRREILPSGKSRAFINDSPVSLKTVKEVSIRLIDIHSQHETLTLTDSQFQFEVIDALAKNSKQITHYQKALQHYKIAKKELQSLIDIQAKSIETHDYNTFLLDELTELKLATLNQEALEQELEQLNNVEHIQQQLLAANNFLSEEQFGVLTALVQLKSGLRSIGSFSSKYEEIFERIHSAHIELEDVFTEIETEQESIEANPERLAQVTEILNTLQNVQQKHNVQTVAELLKIEEVLAEKVLLVSNLDENIAKKEQEVVDLRRKAENFANEVHQKRNIALPKLTQQLEKILFNLGMENAKFNISIQQQENFLENGNDVLSFLFSANKGGSFQELKKAASGGELSRIMLAIKAILSKHKQLPTIMFDEIDTGVSGDVANKMGLLMQYMAENMQVFSITHLPQIASKGASHFKVYKQEIEGVTQSNLKPLTQQERVQEIAEMLGGKKITSTAINHAKELLNL